jgi:hypothetical protein
VNRSQRPSAVDYLFLINLCDLHGRLLKDAIYAHPAHDSNVFSRKAAVADSTEKQFILDSLASALSTARVEIEELRGERAQRVVDILFDVRDYTQYTTHIVLLIPLNSGLLSHQVRILFTETCSISWNDYRFRVVIYQHPCTSKISYSILELVFRSVAVSLISIVVSIVAEESRSSSCERYRSATHTR